MSIRQVLIATILFCKDFIMSAPPDPVPDNPAVVTSPDSEPENQQEEASMTEIGGPRGAEPTRFGDWERNGRCSDF